MGKKKSKYLKKWGKTDANDRRIQKTSNHFTNTDVMVFR